MDANVTGRRPHRGFTLIEMLAVIVIIGILASLITVAALNAIKKAKITRINLEIDQMDMALKEYKNQYGGYPPENLQDEAAVRRHLARAFPRYNANNWMDDLAAADVDPSKIKAGNALVFWLGGIPEQRGDGWVPTGFSANPRMPFATGGSRKKPLFDFRPERLALDENDALAYYPDAGVDAGPEACAYHYFRPPAPAPFYGAQYDLGDRGIASLYWDTRTNEWVNQDTFQIICAGLDNNFGSGNTFPSGEAGTAGITAYATESFDNITNFANGTLEDEVP
ncbi:MAG: type II secretion system protein [Candidatus Nealsonbacteria bacterium]|nr:type II secretion system protein [Candidatus Nealsonbacteria bacterium]